LLLKSYLPQDRLRALANNSSLPDRTSGSALFADISGFTSLTEMLRESLGSRRGAEELTRRLNAVYSVLIQEVEKYGGSVISFAGDAIICWYDGKISAPVMALASAIGIQKEIEKFPELAVKVAIASGAARRFVVGNPSIHYVDALAGAAVARTSTGENLANQNEILVDEATFELLSDSLSIKEWRTKNKERFGVVGKFSGNMPKVQDATEVVTFSDTVLRQWILHSIYERAETNSFMADFRPCAALFIRFTGLDYEADDAQTQLDIFIKQTQTIAERYEGVLLQLTIGDKGSYIYINFGALSAHEDDARRAVKTALELRNKTNLQLQMGITQGVMRVGAYGSETRKTFGALGDDVNLAARLMTNAAPNEILLSSHVYRAVIDHFIFEPRPQLTVKGKSKPIPVFAVTGESQKRAVRLQEPNYSLPMAGRVEELKLIEAKLDLATQGKGQVIGIIAEAGLGKSRLAAEVIRSAHKKGFVGYGGTCQSDGIHTPYLAWKPIWQAFFDVDHEISLRVQMLLIEDEIKNRAPSRVDAMPLLNVVLDLNIPENDFTNNLEPKIRQSALHALLEDCLKAAAKDKPILIVIEDLHWTDALAHDLLEQLAKALDNEAVCFVLAYRPPQIERLQTPRLEVLPQFTKVELHELRQAEAESAIRAKLAQLYPARSGTLPHGLEQVLMERAQGNPFYLEELLNYVRDRGLDPADIENIELPDSLHSLILSRIDQLSEQEKITLRVASIAGRSFRAKWLTGYYPEFGELAQVKSALEQLHSLDITPLDTPEPELAYTFKHSVTHEVTYESLPFATRAKLHEQLAHYLENLGADSTSLLETITHHYEHSENVGKQREYYLKAGETAQRNFANDAALEFYGKLLPILSESKECFDIYLKRGEVLELTGTWNEAEADYRSALELGKGHTALKASAQFALGKLNRLRGNYEPALEWLTQAQEEYSTLSDHPGLAKTLIETGTVFLRKGEYTQAGKYLNEGLKLASEAGDNFSRTLALNHLGTLALNQGDYFAARTLYEESLSLRREMGAKQGISATLTNLGILARRQGDYSTARDHYEQSLVIDREIGDKQGIASTLNNLGLLTYSQGDHLSARALYEESLELRREMSDKRGISNSLGNLGNVALAQRDFAMARHFYEESLALDREMDDKSGIAYGIHGLGMVALAEGAPEARTHLFQGLRLREALGEQFYQTTSLIGIAGLILREGNPKLAAQLLGAAASALKLLNTPMENEIINFHAHTLAGLKEQLGEAGFQSAWEAGSTWGLEETVKKCLEL